jgi:hypothetical protein
MQRIWTYFYDFHFDHIKKTMRYHQLAKKAESRLWMIDKRGMRPKKGAP